MFFEYRYSMKIVTKIELKVAFALEINSPQERKAPSGNFRFAPNGIDSNISFHLRPSERE